jgi:hypothetical protein
MIKISSMLAMARQWFGEPMNDGPKKFHTGYLCEGLELFIRKVAYTKYDANVSVRSSNYKGFTMLRTNMCLITAQRMSMN